MSCSACHKEGITCLGLCRACSLLVTYLPIGAMRTKDTVAKWRTATRHHLASLLGFDAVQSYGFLFFSEDRRNR